MVLIQQTRRPKLLLLIQTETRSLVPQSLRSKSWRLLIIDILYSEMNCERASINFFPNSIYHHQKKLPPTQFITKKWGYVV